MATQTTDSTTQELDPLKVLKARLARIGIAIEYVSNVPWIYLYKINGQLVTEKYEGNHGFTVAFLPVARNRPLRFTDLSTIFNLIRTYINAQKT